MGFKKTLQKFENDYETEQSKFSNYAPRWIAQNFFGKFLGSMPGIGAFAKGIGLLSEVKQKAEEAYQKRHADWLKSRIEKKEKFGDWRRRLIDKEAFSGLEKKVGKFKKKFKQLETNDPFQMKEYGIGKGMDKPADYYINKERKIFSGMGESHAANDEGQRKLGKMILKMTSED